MSGELEKELRGAVAHEKKMGVQGGWMEDLGSLLDTIDALRTELVTERAAREKAERETAERCAKIAEALYTEATVNRTKAGHPTLNGQLAIYVVGRVAEAIRKEFALSPSYARRESRTHDCTS